MPKTARSSCTESGLRLSGQSRSPTLIVLSVLTLGVAATAEISFCSSFLLASITSTARAQPAESRRVQLRAQIKSAAEKLNDIASAAPDMVRAMFAGNTPSAGLLALDERSVAAEAEL